MKNDYSVDNLLDFLAHAADYGVIPRATAQALSVASRSVFEVLDDPEKSDLRQLDLDGVVKRFANKRSRDFSPSSLKEYGNRVRRAVDLFVRWRSDPANFSVRTRATKAATGVSGTIPPMVIAVPKLPEAGMATAPQREYVIRETDVGVLTGPVEYRPSWPATGGGYQTSIPIRPGVVVTLVNVPVDLTGAEAEKLADFIKMLAVG